MLAERRSKIRYILNPRKCSWSADESNFGRRLMQQMGWSDGKGLGREEQGGMNPIKVAYKNDSKGMGYKGAPGSSVQQQDEFSQLLEELNKTAETLETDPPIAFPSSLEKRSETTRSRLHYQKFTRGKDLSRYSEKDLVCIVGTGKLKKESEEKCVDVSVEKKEDSTYGIPTTNGGLIGDYFKRKMQALKFGKLCVGENKANDNGMLIGNKNDPSMDEVDKEESVNMRNKKKKAILKDGKYVQLERNEIKIFKKEKGKKKKERHSNEMEVETKSTKRMYTSNEEIGHLVEKKSKKAKKSSNHNNIQSDIEHTFGTPTCPHDDSLVLQKKKKKKKNEKF